MHEKAADRRERREQEQDLEAVDQAVARGGIGEPLAEAPAGGEGPGRPRDRGRTRPTQCPVPRGGWAVCFFSPRARCQSVGPG